MFNEKAKQECDWTDKFNQLCFEVFHNNPKGKELLEHLEHKFFRGPVAFPNMEPSWAYFNEGKNEMIRSFTVGIQSHMNGTAKSTEPKIYKGTV